MKKRGAILSDGIPRNPWRTGFSLLELLVASAVLSFFVIMLFAVLQQTSSAWNTAENRMDANREARAALNIIGRDLSMMLTGDGDGRVYLNAEDDPEVSLSGAPPPAELGDTFFFLATLPGRAQEPSGNRSDLCMVGYYLSWSAAGPVGVGYNLYRFLRSSDETVDALVGGGEALVTASVTADDLLGSNIRSFKVALYRDENGGLVEVDPWPVHETPALVEVRLTALNHNTARRIRNLGPEGWHDLPTHAANVEREFRLRIRP